MATRYYARYRRGYPPAAVDTVAQTFALDTSDVVVDLGCGTGPLTLPLAKRERGHLKLILLGGLDTVTGLLKITETLLAGRQ